MRHFRVNFAFTLIFSSVLFLTLLSGGTSFWLATKPKLSIQQNRVFEQTTTTWQMGVGVIFGLLGSKATDLFDSGENDD